MSTHTLRINGGPPESVTPQSAGHRLSMAARNYTAAVQKMEASGSDESVYHAALQATKQLQESACIFAAVTSAAAQRRREAAEHATGSLI